MKEYDFIQKLKKIPLATHKVLVGIGDDSAVVSNYLLFKTDTLVEGNHFSLEYFSPEQIGWKAVVKNVSDIIAMGGYPTYMLVALAYPRKVSQAYLLRIYAGIKKAAQKYNIALVGGDLTCSKNDLVISISLMGKVKKKNLMLSSGAKPGDFICISGELGASSAGLYVLRRKKEFKSWKKFFNKLIKKHVFPEAQWKTARFLARSGKVNAITDISDGIASDLRKILRESQVGAVLDFDRILVSPEASKVMRHLRKPFWHSAVFGGEDFEFLFTISSKNFEKLIKKAQKAGLKITCIGKIIRDKKTRLYQKLPNGFEKLFQDVGFDQFHSNDYSY